LKSVPASRLRGTYPHLSCNLVAQRFMHTFELKSMDIQSQKEMVNDFRLWEEGMSTSFLCHGFSLVGYDYVCTRYMGGAVIFSIMHKREKFRYSFCRSRDIIFRGQISRRFRTIPIGSQRVFLDFEVQGLECRRCRKTRQDESRICRSPVFLQSRF